MGRIRSWDYGLRTLLALGQIPGDVVAGNLVEVCAEGSLVGWLNLFIWYLLRCYFGICQTVHNCPRHWEFSTLTVRFYICLL